MNATVTWYTSSVNGVSLPNYWPLRRVTVHGCTVRSPLTGCQVTARPYYRLSRFSKWSGTSWTSLICVLLAQMMKGRNTCGASWELCGKDPHQSHLQTMYIYPHVPCICHFCWTPQPLKTKTIRCFKASGNLSSATRCHVSVDLYVSTTSAGNLKSQKVQTV